VSTTGTVVTVSGNTVTGELPPPNNAQNGIQVSNGAVGTVTGNTVTNNQCGAVGCGPGLSDNWAIGILLLDAGAGTAVSNNTVSNNDAGLLNVATVAGAPTLTASGNTFTNNRYAGVLVSATTMNLTANTIRGGEWGVVASVRRAPARARLGRQSDRRQCHHQRDRCRRHCVG
jgi:parallel beta-helix repeat protein